MRIKIFNTIDMFIRWNLWHEIPWNVLIQLWNEQYRVVLY